MIIHDMREELYHSRPELSSTQARLLLESPAKYRYTMDHPRPGKRSFDVGSAAHTKILGTGSDVVEYPAEHLTPSGAVSTKAATLAWAEEKRSEGLIPVSPADVRAVNGMAEAVLAYPAAREVLENIAGREVTVIADVDGVPCRARFDLYDGTNAADLKSTRDASPKAFNKSVGSFGYHLQERWYEDVHHAETGHRLESFRFLVVEVTAPYLVGVYDLDWMWDDIAQKRTKQARDTYRACVESGEWPGYSPLTLTPPTWAIYEDAEEEIKVA